MIALAYAIFVQSVSSLKLNMSKFFHHPWFTEKIFDASCFIYPQIKSLLISIRDVYQAKQTLYSLVWGMYCKNPK